MNKEMFNNIWKQLKKEYEQEPSDINYIRISTNYRIAWTGELALYTSWIEEYDYDLESWVEVAAEEVKEIEGLIDNLIDKIVFDAIKERYND